NLRVKAALCAIGRVRASCDTNAVPDRFLQSMRVRLPGSGQWYSSVKPHDFTSGSQNYVRPHNGRARTAVEIRPKPQARRAPKICWRPRPRTGSIGSSGKIQASRGRGLVAVTGRQGRSASLPAAARDVHVPVRPARRRAGAGRPRRGELPAALRALVFGPPALLAAAAGADRPDRPHAQDRRRFRPPQWLFRPPQPAHRHHPAGARRHLCPLHGGALRPDHGAAPGAALVHRDHPDLVPFRAGGLHLHARPLCAAAQFAIEAGSVTLLEPDVALTDFGLTIECLALAAWLHWRTPMNPLRTWFVTFFAALGIAALLGGITHGFLDDPRSTLYGLTWSATLLAIGIAAVATWTIGARLLFSERTAKRVLVVAGLLFIVYAATILWISRSFTVAIVTYVPAVAFLLLAFA